MAPFRDTIDALYVIYDADGTPTGELIYMVKKLLGIAHCAACDITHGPRREKPEFTHLKASAWAVPLHNIHRDEMDLEMKQSVAGVLPCVVAKLPEDHHILLGPQELEMCGGDVRLFENAVNEAAMGASLYLPSNVCHIRAKTNDTEKKLPQTLAPLKLEKGSFQEDLPESQDAVVPQLESPMTC